MLMLSLATVSGFSVTQFSTTSVSVMWESINTTGVSHYTVYYTSTSKRKRETDSGNVTFPANTNQCVMGGLDPNLNYVFAISVTFNIRGKLYEGDSTPYITPLLPNCLLDVVLSPSVTLLPSSTCKK